MGLVKKCPTCGTNNAPFEMMCPRCLGDVSGIVPKEEGEAVEQAAAVLDNKTNDKPDAKKNEPADKDCLILKTKEGKEIKVRDGDIIGRKAVGEEVLADCKTVSRKHARFTCEDGRWYIEDLNSTNESYLDDARLPTNRKVEIRPGQRLTLSSSFAVMVDKGMMN